ncbi:MAG TPA: TRAP transporter small permease [Alphaproteobacteria bacterium]|nr:TRAP transporter small permease [Alphaproteobacteria bacterium]
MASASVLVLQRQRHLKWRALDGLERILMILCGVSIVGFSTSVLCDIITREIGHPWLWLQEVTSTFFTYGVFIGAAVATRRNDHLYLTAVAEALKGRVRLVVEVFNRAVVIVVGLCMVYFGSLNFLSGFTSFRMPSMTPIASLYAVIPISGLLVVVFTLEQLVNGWRNGFADPELAEVLRPREAAADFPAAPL